MTSSEIDKLTALIMRWSALKTSIDEKRSTIEIKAGIASVDKALTALTDEAMYTLDMERAPIVQIEGE